MRRGVSTLQGAGRPGWLKHGHWEHSASSLPPGGLHLICKEKDHKNNRAFWNTTGAQKRVLASELRSTTQMKYKGLVCPT